MRTVRLPVTGELDLATADRVEHQALRALTGRPAPERLILDLGGLTFCDSSGVDVLLAVRAEAERLGVDLRVERACGIVLRTLELTGVLGLLTGGHGTSEPGQSGQSR